jgi:excisionase family DNA binding protein
MKMNEKRLLNRRQVADYLGATIYTIDSWVSCRRMLHFKVGGWLVRFDLGEVLEWLKTQRVEPRVFPSSSKKSSRRP